jgi:hypothetical protein
MQVEWLFACLTGLDSIRRQEFTGIMINLSARQLRRAASLQDKIASLQRELARLLQTSIPSLATGKRRKMSAAGRARIAAAQRARWAKVRSRAAKRK